MVVTCPTVSLYMTHVVVEANNPLPGALVWTLLMAFYPDMASFSALEARINFS